MDSQHKNNFKIKEKHLLKVKLKEKVKQKLSASDEQLCREFYSDGMPKCFDWRNVNGTNYDTPIKRQGDCGSCYAVAMLSAVESRIRISTNNVDQPFLSMSEAISCNSYNQGCNGGNP